MVRCHYHLVNTLGLYINTLEYTELLNGLILMEYMEVRYSLFYYILLVKFYRFQFIDINKLDGHGLSNTVAYM